MQKETKKHSRYKIIKFYPRITSETLLEEIAYRKIDRDIANKYLKQAFVLDRDSGRKSVCFTFENSSNGHVLEILNARNNGTRSNITGINAFTLIGGIETDRAEIFADHWDFLTWLTMNREPIPRYNSYILNSFSNTVPALQHILDQEFETKSVFEFLPNILDGEYCRQFIHDQIEKFNILFASQSYIYRNYKGISSYWAFDSEAGKHWPISST